MSNMTVRPLLPLTEGGSSASADGGMATDEAVIDKAIHENDDENLARQPRIARRPHAPTKAEVVAHMTLHAEYRDWCPHCVHGRGISHQHRTSKNEKLGREFSLDYAFMTAEDVGEDMCPVLIGFDHVSNGIWALAVDQKGATRSSTKWVASKIDEAGCAGTQVTIRSDQEESIIALKKAVAVFRQAETVSLESPVRDSKANGAAERAVRTWAGQLRTLRHHLESRLKCPVPKDSPLMTWLVSWAADVVFRYKVHSNGRTSHEWITGHRCTQPVAGFAENINFKFTTDKNHRNKMNSEWSTGFFVGINGKTTEYLVANEDGIFSCATIRTLPDDEAYDPECIGIVNMRYRDYVIDGSSSNPPNVRFTAAGSKNADTAPLVTPSVPRRTRLTPDDFQTFGYTVGCQGCEQLQVGSPLRRNHSQACRDRIEMELSKTDQGKDRLDRTKDRLDTKTAELVENMMDGPTVDKEVRLGTEIPTVSFYDEMQSGQGEIATEQEDDAMDAHDFEDGPATGSESRPREIFIGTPPVQRPKRRGDNDDMIDDEFKIRRMNTPEGEALSPTMDDGDDSDPVGLSGTMLDSLDVIDRKILASAILGIDITEVYSPERVAKVARSFGLQAGSSFDLTNGWDFCREDHKRLAWSKIREESPYLLIGSPPCTYFSMLQELNIAVHGHKPEWMAKFEEEKRKAITHIEFCCSLYRYQIEQGRHFLHEHPWSARSWGLECVEKLLEHPSVEVVQGHMCRFRMTTHIETKGGEKGLVKKPTGFMSSSRFIRQELGKTCNGDHAHVPLVGGRAAGAQIYPPLLCEAICRGVYKQQQDDASEIVSTGAMSMEEVRSYANHICSLQAVSSDGIRRVLSIDEKDGNTHPVGDYPEHWCDQWHELEGGDDYYGVRPQQGVTMLRAEMSGLSYRSGYETAWDDVSNENLVPELVHAARAIEMSYFEKLGVYERVPRSHQVATGGKVIGVRWVDVNKGDAQDTNYRSRLVGREFNVGKDDALYASTPPLEALRLIVSHAATQAEDGRRRLVMINDVRRAYFYAKIQRDVYIELPKEDPDYGKDILGKLRLCLYGTRDAAKGWQETLSSHLESIGFKRGRGHPSVFWHPEKMIKTLVHGDDYVSSGSSDSMRWLESELSKAYELQSQKLGEEGDCQLEGKVLNRILRCTKALSRPN